MQVRLASASPLSRLSFVRRSRVHVVDAEVDSVSKAGEPGITRKVSFSCDRYAGDRDRPRHEQRGAKQAADPHRRDHGAHRPGRAIGE